MELVNKTVQLICDSSVSSQTVLGGMSPENHIINVITADTSLCNVRCYYLYARFK